MTIAIILVGSDAVFFAADTRSSNAITGTALAAQTEKLYHLDGPVAAVTAGFGSSLTRDLMPMVDTLMKSKGISGDLDFIDDWVAKLGRPIYALGEALLTGLGGAHPQLVVAFGGVGLSGPEVRIRRFDTGAVEVVTPGGFAAFGTDTSEMNKMAQSGIPPHLRPGGKIQADQWAFELCRQSAELWPESVAFPMDMMIIGPTAGISARVEASAAHLPPTSAFLMTV